MTHPVPQFESALAFLRKRPTPFAHLVGIQLDGATREKISGGIVGRSFRPDELDDGGPAHQWLADIARTESTNAYFTVNALRHPMTGKPAKKDVGSVVSFQVDLDCPAGEDVPTYVVRVADSLRTFRNGILVPSWIVASGGGLQAFWDLQSCDRIQIDGDIAKAQEAERYTRWLESEVSEHCGAKADATYNVDRIMRLPFLVNWPDAKKISKGRKPALATVLR